MHKFTNIPMLASLLTLGACQLDAKNIGTPDTTGEPSTGAPPDTDPTMDPSATATATATTTNSEPTDTTTSEPADTDTTTNSEPEDTDTETTTSGPAICLPEDPATSAAFKVLLDAWPDQADDAHDIERTCTIDGVASDLTTVTTTLTCDVDGVPRGATIEIAAAPEGAVDWDAGLPVLLRSHADGDEFGQNITLRVSLADDPEAVFLFANDSWGDNIAQSLMFGPIKREITNSCGSDIDDKRFELTYSLTEGASVSIMSGRRDALVIDATHSFAIDLASASEDCCHGFERSLIRRVKL